MQFRDEVLKSPGGREVLFSGRPDNTEVPWINDRILSICQVTSLPSLTCDVRRMRVSVYPVLPGPATTTFSPSSYRKVFDKQAVHLHVTGGI